MTDDAANNPKKPLRSPSNIMKDLKNTYVKHEHGPKKDLTNFDVEQAKDETEKDEEKGKEMSEKNIEITEVVQGNELELIQNKLAETEQERDDLKEQMQRLAAELENFRRRSLKEKREMLDYANERLLFDLLPILDDFSAAIEAGNQNSDYSALLKGFELIYQKLIKLFESAGVKVMDDIVGKPFDVDFHDALMRIPSEFPVDYVVQVIQPGYMIHDKVLRHAKVITSGGEMKESTEN
ncbi:MAG: nucleotide exchange factor GrpE [FCB group bacterium]|jgi:molecular chaperone GrpE